MGRGKYCGPTVLTLVVCLCHVITSCYAADKPCAARRHGDTVECICNATYCDDITREKPGKSQFFAYSTTKDGKRFSKTSGHLKYHSLEARCTSSIFLDPSTLYQSIEGFGGATSDSSAALWVNLTSPRLKKYLIDSFFSSNGIEFNMIRVPIGASDFSPSPYTYQDQPEDDPTLSNFSLTNQDYEYKIPMLKAAMKAATAPIHNVGSMWGPPLWMKTIHEVSGVAMVKEDYFDALAKYHHKFLQKYAAAGVPFWALTTPNEPLSGIMALGHNIRVTWTTQALGDWIAYHLGPTIRNSKFKDVKIISVDDTRMTIGLWFNWVVTENPKALDYIDGVGVHFYVDDFIPPQMLTVPLRGYEDKFVIYTESSLGLDALTPWKKAEKYTHNILEDLNYNVTGFIDWNMCLNTKGGPSWTGIQLDAPIIINLPKAEFTKQPMFYALGHFSKFLPRGSKRISKEENFVCGANIDNVSFLTPKKSIVTILQNQEDKSHTIQIKVGYRAAVVTVPPSSITTVEFSAEI